MSKSPALHQVDEVSLASSGQTTEVALPYDPNWLHSGKTMTLTIDFAPEEIARLREKASVAGTDIGKLVHDAAMETVDRPTLVQLLSPVHQSTLRAGVGVDEVDRSADRAVREARDLRRANRLTHSP